MFVWSPADITVRALRVSEIFLPDPTRKFQFLTRPDPYRHYPIRPAGNGSGRVYPRVRVDPQCNPLFTVFVYFRISLTKFEVIFAKRNLISNRLNMQTQPAEFRLTL